MAEASAGTRRLEYKLLNHVALTWQRWIWLNYSSAAPRSIWAKLPLLSYSWLTLPLLLPSLAQLSLGLYIDIKQNKQNNL